jgi:hypothetical protein
MNEQPKLRVSDVGVISVDSNDLARSKAGRKQIEALERLTENRRIPLTFTSNRYIIVK